MMLEITPISIFDILGTLVYLLSLWITSGMVITSIKSNVFKNLGFLTKLIIVITLGMAFSTLVLTIFAYFHALTNCIVIIFSAIIMTLGLLSIITRRNTLLFNIKCAYKIRREKFYYIALSSFILLTLWSRLALINGVYTYPGDDPKLYALISKRIIEEQGVPYSWGKYAFNEWIAEKLHLYMLGMPILVASSSLFLGIPIYKLVAIITQVAVWINILGLAALSEVLWRNKYSTLFSIVIYGLLVAEPSLTWITWGGNAELCGLAYLPALILLMLLYIMGLISFWWAILYGSLLMAAATITHPFVIIYYLSAIVAALMAYTLLKRSKRSLYAFLLILCSSALSLAIDLPILLHIINEELAVKSYYEPSINPGWTPIFTRDQDIFAALSSFASRMISVYGFASFLIPIVIFLFLSGNVKLSREVTPCAFFLVLWWLSLFFLHENNPNGLWLVKFPLWYRIDANRTFAITSMPIALLESIALGSVLTKNIWKLSPNDKVVFRISLAIFFTYVLVFNAIAPSLIEPYSMFDKDDAKLLPRITNIIGNSNIFVFPNDAGQWIPSILGMPVILPMGVATKHDVLNKYYLEIYPTLSKDPCSPKIATFFIRYNISYVYRGSKQGHLEIYPYVLSEQSLNSCNVLDPVISVGDAVLYKYNKPIITKLYEIRLEKPIIWHDNSQKSAFETEESALVFYLNDSWTGVLINMGSLSVNRSLMINNLLYVRLRWRTDKDVRMAVEVLRKDNRILRVREPISAATFFKWGNGTIGWLDDYVRIPPDTIQIRFLFEGSGRGELSKKIQIIKEVIAK